MQSSASSRCCVAGWLFPAKTVQGPCRPKLLVDELPLHSIRSYAQQLGHAETYQAPSEHWRKEMHFSRTEILHAGATAFRIVHEIYSWFGMDETRLPAQGKREKRPPQRHRGTAGKREEKKGRETFYPKEIGRVLKKAVLLLPSPSVGPFRSAPFDRLRVNRAGAAGSG